jgi:hypothetical protein
MGGIVRDAVTPIQLETSVGILFSQLPPATQAWAQAQASAIVRQAQFGPTQQRELESQIALRLPGADLARVVAVVRYLALKETAGGNFSRLFGKGRVLTPLQQQLLAGVSVIG